MTAAVCPKCGIAACGKHCLAAKRQTPYGPCQLAAGAGTDHLGFGTCKLHGGSTAAGRRRGLTLRQDAFERILELLDPALAKLRELLQAESEDVQLRAVRDILDRAGLGARFVHEHTGPGGGPIPVAVEVRVAGLLQRARALRPPATDDEETADG